ncbi:MAG: hypothetical protein COW00_10055 [Bdellovibrio sp. CG12_big_fil_rev_8_21_14_0_65_39_13]|nr:MAG: hypothetical protein COW78_01260 [Bdellovibrio sp. CG22_combo_CG10-13_8_21_14_all_39_27]PIQ59454.1 MAG: hypothetical protein COW00_10055 [Bdellovibrio sp. CG12_big_fil_rev_8_21_14_0_65_39_13]PIR36584.1 MAG: hypothetical protein COV37_02785 [Bdellovibrio sp. CG11_big_fil_rev_8_21_14_0_20_39_38]
MALSIRAQQFVGEYPKSKESWDHPVAQALSASAISLLNKYKTSQKVIDWNRWEWREVENYMRDSNLISAWSEEDVDAYDLPSEWKKIRSWVRWNHLMDQLSSVSFQFQKSEKGQFRREIELLRQFHDYFNLFKSSILIKLADINGGEIFVELLPEYDEEHSILFPLLEKDIQLRGGDRFKLVAY